MPNVAACPAMTSVKLPIQKNTEVPPIMKAQDPTAKRNLINTKCTHQCQTCNNTPSDVPAITQAPPQIIPLDVGIPHEKQRLTRILTQRTNPTVEFTPGPIIIPPYPIPGGIRASACLISQQALNMMMMKEAINPPRAFTPNICMRIIQRTHPKLRTFCITHGSSYNGQNDHQLQTYDA
jgi:hypothetical protein